MMLISQIRNGNWKIIFWIANLFIVIAREERPKQSAHDEIASLYFIQNNTIGFEVTLNGIFIFLPYFIPRFEFSLSLINFFQPLI
jgi:cytochrome b subunit of formate dehydrogenase